MFNPNNQRDLFRALFQVPLQPQEKLIEIWNAINRAFNKARLENASAVGELNRKLRTKGSLDLQETSQLAGLKEENQHIQQWRQALELLKSPLTRANTYLGALSQTIEGLETLVSLASNISLSIMRDAYEMILDRVTHLPPAEEHYREAKIDEKTVPQKIQHAHQQLAHLYLYSDEYTKIDVAASHRHFNPVRTTFTYSVKDNQAKIIRTDPLFSAPTLIALWVAMFHRRQPIQDYLLHLFKTTLGYPECQTLSALRQQIEKQRILTSYQTDVPFDLQFAESMLGIFDSSEGSTPTEYLNLLLTAQRRSARAQIIYVFVATQYGRFDNLFKHTADALCSLLHPETTRNPVLRATLTLYYTRALDVVPAGFPVEEIQKLLEWIKTRPDEAPRFYPKVNFNITPKTDKPSRKTIAAQNALNALLIVPTAAGEDPVALAADRAALEKALPIKTSWT